MNREQAALYTRILNTIGAGALKTLLPDVPVENYKFIKAFGEGKRVAIITEKGTSVFRDKMDFTLCSDDYRIAPQKRFCNGVELDDCLQTGDKWPFIIFIIRPDKQNGYEEWDKSSIHRDYLTWAIGQGFVYATSESVIKHAEAMRIVEVLDD